MSKNVAPVCDFVPKVGEVPDRKIDRPNSSDLKVAEHMTLQENYRVEKKQKKESGSVNRPDSVHSGRQSRPQKDFRGFKTSQKVWVGSVSSGSVLWVVNCINPNLKGKKCGSDCGSQQKKKGGRKNDRIRKPKRIQKKICIMDKGVDN